MMLTCGPTYVQRFSFRMGRGAGRVRLCLCLYLHLYLYLCQRAKHMRERERLYLRSSLVDVLVPQSTMRALALAYATRDGTMPHVYITGCTFAAT